MFRPLDAIGGTKLHYFFLFIWNTPIFSIFAAHLQTKFLEMLKNYETVFIATPVLSEAQMKEAVAKYSNFIKDNGGEVVYEEDWGLKQLAYPIQHKTSGFYHLIEFKADTQLVAALETQYHRDERIIRFITVALDKDAVAYAEKRRANRQAKTQQEQ